MRVLKNSAFLVAMRSGETPVPIPNTMVKTWAADGTALETVWESRWPPKQKRKKTGFGMKLQISRFERTSPRNLKYQPTNVWKDHTKSLGIDTGKDEQQLITANPISREVLLEIAGVHQWLEIKRDFSFWWLMKEAVSCTLKIAYKEKYLMKIRELN